MRDYDALKDIRAEGGACISRAFEVGYCQGYEDGVYGAGDVAVKNGNEAIEKAYQKGLDVAWECARKVCTNWCISDTCLAEIFGKGHTIDDIMRLNSASEAIAKVEEYEKRAKIRECEEKEPKTADEIKVGDEVIDDIDGKAIAVRDTYYIGADKEAFTLIWYGQHMASKPIAVLKKTGRNFPQIADVLRQMKEG